MNKLEKNKYCLICLGDTKGIRDEILSISLDPYKYIQGDNMVIVTFVTFLSPIEMRELFGSTEYRSYFLFEMTSDTAMVSLSDKDLQDYLFDSLVNPKSTLDIIDTPFGSMGVNKMDNSVEKGELFRPDKESVNKRMSFNGRDVKNKGSKFSEDKLNSYSKEERDELVDTLLEKGINLTDNDKEVLNFLINKKDE